MGRSLTNDARRQLLELLGYGAKYDLKSLKWSREELPRELDAIIVAIEQTLVFHEAAAFHLDNAPRPAHYVATFKKLCATAKDLHEDMCGLTEYYAEQFTNRGADTDRIERAIADVVNVSCQVIAEFGEQSSKGTRKKVAIRETKGRLRKIFDAHVQCGGHLTSGQRNRRRIRFVEAALTAGNIPVPDRRTTS